VVEQPGKHHQQGNPFNIRIDLTVPGSEIVVDKQENADISDALRAAFAAAPRPLAASARQL
jgi:hypothetical protein